MIHLLYSAQAMTRKEMEDQLAQLQAEMIAVKDRLTAIEEFLYDQLGEMP
jgi:hypothetical protein